MNISKCLLSRQQVRDMTGWSFTFIDKNLPRRKIGGKVFISRVALERLLSGEGSADDNPLFNGDGLPSALGTILQLEGGSPHQFGQSGWNAFGEKLVKAFKQHIEATGLNEKIRDLAAAAAWTKTAEAREFFDRNIPTEGRGKEFIFL
jgi:hypothetical protein